MASTSFACATSLARITERSEEGEGEEKPSPKANPQSPTTPIKCRSGVEENARNWEIGGELIPDFAAALLISFSRMGSASDPLARALLRDPEIGDTTAADRLALDTWDDAVLVPS
jgi:hypothetical protein